MCASILARDGVILSSGQYKVPLVKHRRRFIAVELIIALAACALYVAFQRIGTKANASFIEYTPNLAGGFLAIGMTDEQPGFIVLSALDQAEVEVDADRLLNRISGTHTFVTVKTPDVTWRGRLREPRIVLVDAIASSKART